MPVVSLQYKPDRIPKEAIEKLAPALTIFISGALDIPENKDARLKPEDIEVRVTHPHEFNTNAKDLEIMIWAHEYPERSQNIEERKDKIVADVRRFFADYDYNITGWVWILLQPTSFGKI